MRKHNQILAPYQGLDDYTKVCIQAIGTPSNQFTTSYNWSQISGFVGFNDSYCMDITNSGKYIWVVNGVSSYVSRDYGQSFQQLNNTKYKQFVVAKDSGICYASSDQSDGYKLYVSNDGGYNWKNLPQLDINCKINYCSSDGSVVFNTAQYMPDVRPIYLSTNYGQSWTDLGAMSHDLMAALYGWSVGGVHDVAISPNGQHIVLVQSCYVTVGSGRFNSGIVISHDRGFSWTAKKVVVDGGYGTLDSTNLLAPTIKKIVIDNTGQVIVCGGERALWFDGSGNQFFSEPLFVTNDGGNTWINVDPLSTGNYYGLLIKDDGVIFTRSKKGSPDLSGSIAMSTTSGNTWSVIANVDYSANNNNYSWNNMTNQDQNIIGGYGLIYANSPGNSAIFANYSINYLTKSYITDNSIYNRSLSSNNEMIVLNNSVEAKFNSKTVLLGDLNNKHKMNGYISIPYSPDLGLSTDCRTSGTTDSFCIETWFKPAPTSAVMQGSLFNQYVTSGDYVSWRLDNGYSMSFTVVDNSTIKAAYTASYTPSAGNWDHLAVRRNSSGIVFYVNDTALSSIITVPLVSSYVIPTYNAPTTIGLNLDLFVTNNTVFGYINDYRISIGTSRANYPVSHQRSYMKNNLYDKNGYDQYTKLFIDENIDKSPYKIPLVVGAITLSTDAPLFDNIYGFTSNGTDIPINLIVPAPASSKFATSGMALSGSDFALNFWFKDGGNFSGGYNLCGHDNASGLNLAVFPASRLFDIQVFSSAYSVLINTNTPTLSSYKNSEWNHVAFVRNGTNFNLYCNGSLAKQVTGISSIISIASYVNFGIPNGGSNCQIAMMRYDVGTNRGWTGSTIQVPSPTDLSVIDSYTKMFYKGDSLIDLSQYNHTITYSTGTSGTAVKNSLTPKFSNKIMNFPTNGGNFPAIVVQSTNVAPLVLTSENFVIDFWFKNSYATTRQWIVTGEFKSVAIDINYNGTRNINMWASSNGSTWDITKGDSGGSGIGPSNGFSLNTWTHVAYVRSGSVLNLYVNGILYKTTSISTSIFNIYKNPSNSARAFYIGGDYTSNPYKGQLSQFRYSVGTDRGWNTPTIIVPQKPITPLGFPIDGKTTLYINGESKSVEDADQSIYHRTATFI